VARKHDKHAIQAKHSYEPISISHAVSGQFYKRGL